MKIEKLPPPVSAIVLNWNGKEHLEYCLASLTKTEYPNYEIILVDNASYDGSTDYVRSRFPQITIITNGKNLGVAAGNNVGVRAALKKGSKFIVILNNDMKFDPRWLTEAVSLAEKEPEIGVIGFSVFGEYVKEPIASFEEASRSWQELEVKETPHIAGCALFVRARLFEELGLFDEAYFAYAEEDDFESRVTRVGYRMVRINIPMWHALEGSWGRRRLKASLLALRNHIRFNVKNESLATTLKGTLKIINISCNPFVRINPGFSHHRRHRPYNVAFNMALVAYALAWNFIRLPQTLAARWAINRKIALVRKTRYP